MSIMIVTFPTAGMYSEAYKYHNNKNIKTPAHYLRKSDINPEIRTLSLTSFSKFFSLETLTHTHPSLSHSVFTLYSALGTAVITTSEIARHCWSVISVERTTWCGWYRFGEGRFVYSWIESISTENTRAPSFARRAASGRPTTSDL